MSGEIIYLIICLFFILVFNVADFAELHEGVRTFFPIIRGPRTLGRLNAFFTSLLMIATIPLLVFDLYGKRGFVMMFILDVSYIAIYTLTYFKIIKIKKEREEDIHRRRKNYE